MANRIYIFAIHAYDRLALIGTCLIQRRFFVYVADMAIHTFPLPSAIYGVITSLALHM